MKTQRFIWSGLGLGLGLVLILTVAFHPQRTTKLKLTPQNNELGRSAAAQAVRDLVSPTKAGSMQPAVLDNTADMQVQELPETNAQDSELLRNTYETGRTNPVAALTLAMESAPATPAGDDLITYTATQWAANDPHAAATWAERVPDEGLRSQLLTAIATVWAESDSVAAAELALHSLPAGRHQDDAVVGIVQRWVQKQPEIAAAWVLDFPAGTLQETALENLVKIWAQQDLEQATHWLEGLADGSSRDLAVIAYVTEITPAFPVLATRWAESIGDARLRNHQLAALAASASPSVH